MPKGEDKARQKEKEKIAIDKTFGLKNKNKSKVVQKYIKTINANVKGTSNKEEQAERKAKEAKEQASQKTALMNSLFNLQTDKKGRAYDPVAKKKAKEAEENAIAAGKKLKEEVRKEIIEGIANTIRLTNIKGIRMSELGGHAIIKAIKDKHQDVFKTIQLLLFIKANDAIFWVDDADNNNPIIRCKEDVDAETAPDERPIEEIIEERRRALPAGGTPVTKETFLAWKQKKEAERLEKVEADRLAAAKKSGGKGLNALSGRDLFTFDASLFVDDEGAASEGEYDERNEVIEDDELQPGFADKADDEEEDEDAGGEADDKGGQDEWPEGWGRPDDDDDDGEDAKNQTGGAASSGGVEINKDLFLAGGDLPDDLDDLDDDEDDKKA